ncbi:MAG: hypothetical protein VBE63_01245 [Lamprobacter sp.]|uniref:hypothetical protein n=1 Tax=Lamprobacter sp. TaxID=3100796 RepID=UPI002B25EAAE|nr:hypothetical protein [Lamprobacter sp.]MEA3638552.1 hypothetical protein [Lamprobacter sp.]
MQLLCLEAAATIFLLRGALPLASGADAVDDSIRECSRPRMRSTIESRISRAVEAGRTIDDNLRKSSLFILPTCSASTSILIHWISMRIASALEPGRFLLFRNSFNLIQSWPTMHTQDDQPPKDSQPLTANEQPAATRHRLSGTDIATMHDRPDQSMRDNRNRSPDVSLAAPALSSQRSLQRRSQSV